MLARRIGSEGRTRAYAWGRSAAREDVAALGERLLAMSGQFEQRRLARPAYQLAVLDSFCGDEQLRRRAEARLAWRELGVARRRYDELTRDAAAAEARVAELRALVEDTEGMEPGQEEALREERERLRHLTELVEGAAAAAEALDPEEGEGAAGLTAAAERALAPVERLAPELQKAADELRDAELRLREAASALRSFLAVLEADPGRLEQVEGELDRIADARRRFRCETTEELLARAAEAKAELEALDQGLDPAEAARAAVEQAEARMADGLGGTPGGTCGRRGPVRGGGRGRAARDRHGRRRVPRGARRARPGRDGRRRGRLPDPAERGAAVRAGGRDRLGRRALARRAGDRSRRRRRDDGLRRDRRGHRRDDRARRRRHARAPGWHARR